MDGRTQYGNFKVKKETSLALQDVKRAVQALSGGKEMTNDEFIMEIVKMAQSGNSAFDAVYQKVVQDNHNLLMLAQVEMKKINQIK